jgi:hypothetical protein
MRQFICSLISLKFLMDFAISKATVQVSALIVIIESFCNNYVIGDALNGISKLHNRNMFYGNCCKIIQ